jgi:DNA polymerase (family 10)
MEAQDAELDALNERLAPFRLLKGVEANIKADGSIDVSDDVLATREWAIASLHTSFDKNPTERVLGAMENPHVHCIGHLTGRKIGKRSGAAIDVERVIEKALETRTVLEIDSQPDRLDMPDFVARLAGKAGVPIAVTSDAHQLSSLGYVEIGVGQARRAWLTKAHVLNTRTWPQVAKLRK